MSYNWPLPNGFPPGSRATIKGIPLADVEKQIFNVNLLTKVPHDGKGDYAYHSSFHYHAGYLAQNTWIVHKGWQEEIRHDLLLEAGKAFEINIICEATHFGLYVNDKHLSDFGHRLPVDKIRCLTVVGSLRVTSVSLDKIKSISWLIPNAFHHNDTINITGFPGVYNSSGRFDVRLQNSLGDVAFGMSVRFLERKIINSSYVAKTYGKEMLHYMTTPLKPGEEFEITISNRSDHFKVFVNLEKGYVYETRVDPEKIKYLVIADDVEVTSIKCYSPEIDVRQSS